MTTILRLAGSAALLALAACSSAPTRFHTLVPPAASPATATAAFVIDVQPVNVPPQVDQPALVLRHGASGVSVMDSERWASPLGDEIRSALAADLSARLGTHDVHGLPLGKDTQVVRVQVDVRRFDSELGGNATLEAAWAVRGSRGSTDCASHVTQPAGSDYESLVAAHQQAIGQLADGIAGAISSVAAGQASACH